MIRLMGDPLVSVILPTRSRADLLPMAIASVMGQTLRDLELIIVDDASTDTTPAVVAAHAAADSRIRGERLASAAGAAAARNRGVSMAAGKYVAFIDDDCVWYPSKLDRQVTVLEELSDAGLSYCPYILVGGDESERVVGADDVTGPGRRRALLRGNVVGTPTVVVRRNLLDDVGGFDERLLRFQDWDLWVRLAAITEFTYVPEPLLRSAIVPGGISTRNEALASACRILQDKFEREMPLERADLAEWRATLGHILMLHGGFDDGRELLLRAVRSWPWPPRRIAMAGCALLGSKTYQRATRLSESVRTLNLIRRIPDSRRV